METEHAGLYQAFEAKLDDVEALGNVKASVGILALYPYSFPIWYRSGLVDPAADAPAQTDSLLWFDGDRDTTLVQQWRAAGSFPFYYKVIGTRLRLATRKSLDQLGPFHDVLATSVPDNNPQG
jgi:hypothetical protein